MNINLRASSEQLDRGLAEAEKKVRAFARRHCRRCRGSGSVEVASVRLSPFSRRIHRARCPDCSRRPPPPGLPAAA